MIGKTVSPYRIVEKPGRARLTETREVYGHG